MKGKLKLTFHGGAGEVTGANFLLEDERERKILIDCGLLQTSSSTQDSNWDAFGYNPSEIDTLIVTHSHIDHIGRIPKLVSEGFQGKIYSTEPTKDLSKVMLEDTAKILSHDKRHDFKSMYSPQILNKVFSLWQTKKYKESFNILDFQSRFLDTGHILGSAMIEFVYKGKIIVFTSDLGNSPSPLLPDAEEIKNVDYLIIESVYGDRNHESRNERGEKLKTVIKNNYDSKGTLVIPTFSQERSQELLLEINNFVENKLIPKMPIFFDSPLAIRLTEVYKKYKEYFNESVRSLIASGDDIFDFPGLRETLHTEDSKSISKESDPKIIIAGSGMSTGGRVLHHEKNYLPNSNNTLLLIGYQAVGTLGRLLQDGSKYVTLFKKKIPVRAKIEYIGGYSGHRDSDGLLDFISKSSAKKIFAVMGEPKSALFLVQRVRDYLELDAYAPRAKETVELKV